MKKILFITMIAFLFNSCTDGFEELNTNPTKTSDVPTSSLLTAAMQDMITTNSSLGYNKTTELYVQHWSQRETTVRSRYGDIESGWSSWYLGGLPELNNIIDLNSGDNKDDYIAYGSNENQIAVAKIMKSWAFLNITDAWGDVPYSEVGNPEIRFPKYDRQSDIYASLLEDLKSANDAIDVTSGSVKGDLLYDGDMSKWKKFANSLRARIAMRMSKVDEAKAKTELTAAINDGVFESTDDDAYINFQEEEKYANPLYAEFLTQQWTYVSRTLTDKMTLNNTITDPRLAVYAAPNKNGNYLGLPYGLLDDESTAFAIDSCSNPGLLIRDATFPSILMTYSEIQFIMAEAAQRGWVSGSASDFYNSAIKANMDFWFVPSDKSDAYIALPEVAYDVANWAEQIGTQKWISFYTQGAQAWAEYRRIGFPVLNVPTGSLNNGATQIPRRFFYNAEESNLNGDQLDIAISNMGGDNFDIRVWWDK